MDEITKFYADQYDSDPEYRAKYDAAKAKHDELIDQQEKSKRDAGRYTLEEAAIFIYNATGERADEMKSKLMDAASGGVLPVYEPGKNARYKYGENFASRVRDFYEEAYWNDINDWLASNEQRIGRIFPNPAAAKQDSEQNKDEVMPNWKMRIQEQASILWRENKKYGSPTKHNIKGDLARWCRANNVTTGESGIFPSEDYIYRHVIRGWEPPK